MNILWHWKLYNDNLYGTQHNAANLLVQPQSGQFHIFTMKNSDY